MLLTIIFLTGSSGKGGWTAKSLERILHLFCIKKTKYRHFVKPKSIQYTFTAIAALSGSAIVFGGVKFECSPQFGSSKSFVANKWAAFFSTAAYYWRASGRKSTDVVTVGFKLNAGDQTTEIRITESEPQHKFADEQRRSSSARLSIA